METTRPLSDLKSNFAEVCEAAHQTESPVFLTKDGQSDMVLMTMDVYKRMQFEWELETKLSVAEKEAELTEKRYSSEEVLQAMREAIWEERLV